MLKYQTSNFWLGSINLKKQAHDPNFIKSKMTTATASDSGLDLTQINTDAVKIYNIVDDLKKSFHGKDQKALDNMEETVLGQLKKLQQLEVNIDVTLETLDAAIIKLQEQVEALKVDKLSLEQKNNDFQDAEIILKEERSTLKSRIAELEKFKRDFEARIEALELELGSTKQKLNEARKELNIE